MTVQAEANPSAVEDPQDCRPITEELSPQLGADTGQHSPRGLSTASRSSLQLSQRRQPHPDLATTGSRRLALQEPFQQDQGWKRTARRNQRTGVGTRVLWRGYATPELQEEQESWQRHSAAEDYVQVRLLLFYWVLSAVKNYKDIYVSLLHFIVCNCYYNLRFILVHFLNHIIYLLPPIGWKLKHHEA